MAGKAILIPSGSGVVPKKTGFSPGTVMIEQRREEADSIEFLIFAELDPGEFGKSGLKVRGVNQIGSY